MYLLVTLFWVITTSVESNRWIPPVVAHSYGTFSTYAECIQKADERITELEETGLVIRVEKYVTQNIHARNRLRWACEERFRP